MSKPSLTLADAWTITLGITTGIALAVGIALGWYFF